MMKNQEPPLIKNASLFFYELDLLGHNLPKGSFFSSSQVYSDINPTAREFQGQEILGQLGLWSPMFGTDFAGRP